VGSPHVQVIIADDKAERTIDLPVAFLRKRSTVFHSLITEAGEQEVLRCMVPSIPTEAALDLFVAWITATEPRLEKGYTLEETVELGTLADHLGVWALSNQAMDLLESQLNSGAWKWSPQALNGMYGEVSAGRPLRRLLLATLPRIDFHQSMFVNRKEELEEEAWKQVFLAHSALGWDYLRAEKIQGTRSSKWTVTKNQPCKYHEHPWAIACEINNRMRYDGACAYVVDDCYPVWKMQEVNRVESEECAAPEEPCAEAEESAVPEEWPVSEECAIPEEPPAEAEECITLEEPCAEAEEWPVSEECAIAEECAIPEEPPAEAEECITFDEPCAEAEELPAEAGEPPAEAEELPAEAGEPPAEAEEPPAEAEEPLAEAKEPPAEAGELPAEAGEPPAEAEELPAEAEELPAEAEELLAEAEELLAEAEEPPAEAEECVKEEEKPPMKLSAIKAEIERMSDPHKKKLKKWMEKRAKTLALEMTEEQLNGWIYTR
jgi:hypothetical protein